MLPRRRRRRSRPRCVLAITRGARPGGKGRRRHCGRVGDAAAGRRRRSLTLLHLKARQGGGVHQSEKERKHIYLLRFDAGRFLMPMDRSHGDAAQRGGGRF